MKAIKDLPPAVRSKVLTGLFFGALILLLLALYGARLANPLDTIIYLPGENWFYETPSSGGLV